MTTLDVHPEVLPTISATLIAAHASLTSVISAAQLPAKPVRAGQDAVSEWASTTMAAYQQSFFGATAPGLAHLLEGAQVLIPVGDDYEFRDVSGGASIVSADSGLQV
ncbi:PE domain-containing protein [Nocardia sp. NBC_01388]|uniref:PE domain-containing protein n=1 Tax=Nocardia sp. NBC_01388 TaxID=2903596 RepID=UPI0032557338